MNISIFVYINIYIYILIYIHAYTNVHFICLSNYLCIYLSVFRCGVQHFVDANAGYSVRV